MIVKHQSLISDKTATVSVHIVVVSKLYCCLFTGLKWKQTL